MSEYETKRKALEKQMRELEAEMAALKMSHEASVKKEEVKKPEENPDDWEKVPGAQEWFHVPAGTYYVGDLCYEMKDELYDDIWGKKFGYAEGLYRRKSDGAVFGMFGTGGDGAWKDDYGKEYTVDAGILGVASVALCKGEETDNYEDFNNTTECWHGQNEDDKEVFAFGHVCLSAPGWDNESDDEETY